MSHYDLAPVGPHRSVREGGTSRTVWPRCNLCGGELRIVLTLVARLTLAAVLGMSLLLPAEAVAQIRLQVQPRPAGQRLIPGGDTGATVVFREDRNVNRAIDKAREAIEAADYDEAIHILGEVLNREEDFFYRREGATNLVSVKAEVRRLLGSMPAVGRQKLELHSGGEARRLLEKALAAGDWMGVAEVASRFFHTQAGYEATWLLALHHRDSGQPLAAALTLRQLADAPAETLATFQPTLSFTLAACWLAAGMENLAAQELEALKANHPDAQIALGDRRVPVLPAGHDPLDWLASLVKRGGFAPRTTEQWLVHRGGPARNQAQPLHSPVVATAWRAPAYDDFVDVNGELGESYLERGVRAALEDIRQLAERNGEPLVLATHPLLVGDMVIFRTATQLVAVDAVTGKRTWTAAVDQNLQEWLRTRQQTPPHGPAAPRPGINPETPHRGAGADQAQVQLTSGLMGRLLNDAAYGTLSSDGEQVFVIEEIAFSVMHPQYQRMWIGHSRRPSYNTLRGYEVASGKLKWELGGEPGEFELELAGNWFLGPPLPLGGFLYALTEKADEIRLVCIDPRAAEGQRVQWAQSLCVCEQDTLGEQTRQMAGVSPSFADGVLICPTGSGAVVAVDLTSRALLWAFQYPAGSAQEIRRHWLVPTTGALYSTPGWCDASATIHQGCVLLTPPGSSRLFGLNLLDGSPLWEPIGRGNALYVAAGHGDKVLLVGASFIEAIDLQHGRVLWSSTFPARQMVAGRGYLAGDTYVVPLSGGNLAQVRLNSGEISIRPLGGSVADDRSPGNLIAVGDRLICQHLHGCDSYLMMSPQSLQQRLQSNERDAEAWMIQGDMQLQQGQWAEAAASLKRAIEYGSAKAGPLLAECRLRQLQADFSIHGTIRAELETLIGQGPLAARYWRIVAEGFAAQRKPVEAAQAYLHLATLQIPHDGGPLQGFLKDVEPALLVRQDRLVAARLRQLWAGADEAQRQAIDQMVRAQLDAVAGEGASQAALRQAIDYFGWHPNALELKWRLVRHLQSSEDASLLEMDLVLGEMVSSSPPQQQAQALATLAKLYAEAGRWDAALWYAGQLKERFSDAALPGGQTAAAVAAGVLEHAEAPAVPAATVWPDTRMRARTAKVAGNPKRRSWVSNVVPMPQFRDWIFETENQHELVVRNDRGTLWRTPYIHPDTYEPIPSAPQGQRVAAHGRLLIVSTGAYLLAIDAAGGGRQPPGKIRWVQPLIDPYIAGTAARVVLPHWETTDWGPRRLTLRSAHSDPLGTMQPVVGRQITFVRGTQLISVDAATGQPLWVRNDITEGSEIFGDDDCIYVIAPDSPRAQVYRTADGTSLPPLRVPPWSHCMRTCGRKMLVWERNGNRVTIRLFNVATQQDEWTRTFEGSPKANFAEDGRLAVVQRDGRFQLLDVETGTPLIDSKIETPETLDAIYVLRYHDRYLVAVSQAAEAKAHHLNGGVIVQFRMPGTDESPNINGFLHGFNEQGQLAWSRPVHHMALPLGQLPSNPCLGMFCHVYGTWPRGNHRVVINRSCIVIVDKRTGRVVYRNLHPGEPRFAEGTLDPKTHTVEFESGAGNLRLEWTDEAWDEDVAATPIEPEPLGELEPAPNNPDAPHPQPRPRPAPQPQAERPQRDAAQRQAAPEPVPLPMATPKPAERNG